MRAPRLAMVLVALDLAAAPARADPPAAPFDAVALAQGCQAGAVGDCTRLGRAYRLGNEGVRQDFARARELLERACTLGKEAVPACADYAELLKGDLGGPRDTGRALAILDRACKARVADACSFLGLIYTEGLAVPEVPYGPPAQRLGARHYRTACDLGHAGACWHLGLLHRSGVGVKKDARRARDLFTRACKAGDATACGELKKKS